MMVWEPNMTRALVWGGLGFIGQHLVHGLLQRGTEVTVLCRARRQCPEPGWGSRVRWLELDASPDREAVMREAAATDVVYDLAGSSGTVTSNLNPLDSLQENCGEHLHFLRACESAATPPHIVFASSWLVHGKIDSLPVTEDCQIQPRSIYATHKACIENYLRIYACRNKITYTVCRISNPYGPYHSRPRRTYNILNLFIEQSLAGKPVFLFGDGSQLRDYIYIDDLVDALILCGECPAARNEVFNISLGRSHSILEAVGMIRSMVAAPPPVFMPWEAEYLAAESGSYVADIGKARRLLGFKPRFSLRRGLETTVCHLRDLRIAGD
ncbi:NAD-dependent epimerase/dehydratase family protein [uncultured Paludibaculum sp.]|uniref:NAD-dependent epimerase/dehydratase family protein n=1 Tax=uncultured Paludibaculum sp. TaxID=1765020 RepID=UPI002AAAFD61|nr:NAD-dependent epimerase/dehydratase family protein [uncultured Paludibaculum sp.]